MREGPKEFLAKAQALITMAEQEGNETLVWKYKALKNGMVAEFLSELVEDLARRLGAE